MNAFLSKPVRKRELITTFGALLSDRNAGASPGEPCDADHGSLAPVAAEPTIDESTLATLAEEIGEDSVGEALRVFVKDTERRLRLLDSLSESDRAAIKAEAHTIKGAAGTLGLRRLSSVASQLETSALDITIGDYRTAVATLKTTFAESREHVDSRAA